jgi:hypothetical protein
MINQVFISYRHESLEHARSVRRLGKLLRQAKLPVTLDQFYLEQNPGGANEGWPKWCEDCANQSSCVIIIGSEGWFTAYDKTAEARTGLGAAAEADLFRQDLWDDKGYNARIRLAFLHEVAPDSVPVRLRAWHQFRPFADDDQLNQLVCWAADCLGLHDIELPTVRWPEPVVFEPDLADRKREWPIIQNLLAGCQRKRILLIEGNSGLGKSVLLRETRKYANKLNIPVAWVELKGGVLNIETILGQFDLDLGAQLPNFSRENANKTHLLRKDLRALRQPVLLVFDSYEAVAENQVIDDWLCQQLLNEVETALGVCVIVAGQKAPKFANAGWHDWVRHVLLQPITEIDHWRPWVERRYPEFSDKGAHLPTVLMVAQGNPGVVSNMCEVIAKAKPQ